MAIDINKEVQDFGPYKLVIRQPKNSPDTHAVLWRGAEKLAVAEASSREIAYEKLLDAFSRHQGQRAALTTLPSDEKIADTFRFLWPQLNPSQHAMLLALRDRAALTASALADAAGYRDFEAANLWLGRAAAFFLQECPRSDLLLNNDGSPVLTSWFCAWDEEGKTWTMREDVARGMRLAHCAPITPPTSPAF